MPARGVPVTVTARAHVTVAVAFGAIAPVDLRRIFTEQGPLPGVLGVRDQTGAWDHVGASRVVELSDGSVATERITAHDAPHSFAYQLGHFTGPLRHLVAHADGDWSFTAEGEALTTIRWTYVFHPRQFAWLVVRFAAAPLWRRYARRVIWLAVEVAESPDRGRRGSSTGPVPLGPESTAW